MTTSQPLTYSEPGFDIHFEKNLLRFSGKMEQVAYMMFEKFLKQLEPAISPTEPCIIDFTELSYLNSRGFRTLSNYLLSSRHTFVLRIDKHITWQNQSLTMLTQLRPQRISL